MVRQYCGNLGKVDNCQVGVFAGYVSEHGYVLVDKRLFLPEKWFAAACRERRQKCNLPSDTVFRTNPQLAAEMLRSPRGENLLPFFLVSAQGFRGHQGRVGHGSLRGAKVCRLAAPHTHVHGGAFFSVT